MERLRNILARRRRIIRVYTIRVQAAICRSDGCTGVWTCPARRKPVLNRKAVPLHGLRHRRKYGNSFEARRLCDGFMPDVDKGCQDVVLGRGFLGGGRRSNRLEAPKISRQESMVAREIKVEFL